MENPTQSTQFAEANRVISSWSRELRFERMLEIGDHGAAARQLEHGDGAEWAMISQDDADRMNFWLEERGLYISGCGEEWRCLALGK